jgi:hypothetical protein
LPLPILLVLLDELLFKWQKAIGDFRVMAVFVAEIQVVSQPSQVVHSLLYRNKAAGSSLLIVPRDRGGDVEHGGDILFPYILTVAHDKTPNRGRQGWLVITVQRRTDSAASRDPPLKEATNQLFYKL